MKCDKTVLLPKGNRFETWEKPFVLSKTYHVAKKAPTASDDNDGTAEKPFRTVSKAASVLMPGKEAVIHDGIYREWVHRRSEAGRTADLRFFRKRTKRRARCGTLCLSAA